nr:unnamed protein product [Callosobruchus analis]
MTNINCETSQDLIPIIRKDTHHPSLSVSCNISISKVHRFDSNISLAGYNFRKANFIELYNALTYVNWSFLENSDDVDILR